MHKKLLNNSFVFNTINNFSSVFTFLKCFHSCQRTRRNCRNYHFGDTDFLIVSQVFLLPHFLAFFTYHLTTSGKCLLFHTLKISSIIEDGISDNISIPSTANLETLSYDFKNFRPQFQFLTVWQLKAIFYHFHIIVIRFWKYFSYKTWFFYYALCLNNVRFNVPTWFPIYCTYLDSCRWNC